VVHLQGAVNPPNFAGRIFTLPEGSKPSSANATNFHQFGVLGDGAIAPIEVQSDGDVVADNSVDNILLLEGVTFRAAG
jgi:hypothetical protein